MLSESNDVRILQNVRIQADGGIGKTALATEYARRNDASYPGKCYFLSCEVEDADWQALHAAGSEVLQRTAKESVTLVLAALAVQIGLSSDDPSELAHQLKCMIEEDEGRTLLIFDNVVDRCQWDAWVDTKLLPEKHCAWLVTTRDTTVKTNKTLVLGQLDPGAALDLLSDYRDDASYEENQDIVARIAAAVDHYALALIAIGSSMEERPDLSWADFESRLVERGFTQIAGDDPDRLRPIDYKKNIEEVYAELYENLPELQQRVAEFAAYLSPDGVPTFWLHELAGGDEAAKDAVGRMLYRGLLIERDAESKYVALHRVLAAWIRARMEEQADRLADIVDSLIELGERRGRACNKGKHDRERWPELSPLATLAIELDRQGRPLAGLIVANWIHEPLGHLARWEEGRRLLARFLDGRVPLLDLDDDAKIQIAHANSNLALTLKDLGDLAGAKARMAQAIAIKEQAFEEDHPQLATSYSNLALILQDLGDLAGAKARMEQAIAIKEEAYEEDHPTFATSYSNLALILQDYGDLAGAKARMEQAIEIDEEAYEENHPTLATRYSNLATILRDFGDLAGAKARMEQAIAIDEEAYEADHPTLAIRYSNLALILQDLGDLAGAKARMEQAIAIEEEAYEEDHPTFATSYNNLAHILWDLGERAEAIGYMSRAVSIWRKRLPEGHPHTVQAENALAYMLKMMDESPEG